MAEQVSASDDKKPKRAPKNHNIPELIKALSPFVTGMMKAYDAMEEDHGSHVLGINNKFDAIAEKIDFPKALIRKQFAKIRRQAKESDTLKDMEDAELDQEIMLMEGWAGTGFGSYTSGYLDKLKAEKKRRSK